MANVSTRFTAAGGNLFGQETQRYPPCGFFVSVHPNSFDQSPVESFTANGNNPTYGLSWIIWEWLDEITRKNDHI